MIVLCSYAQGAEKKQPFFLLLINFVDRIPLWINFNFFSIKQFFCCETFKLFLQKIFFSLQTIGNFGCTQLGFNLQSCSSIRGNLQQSYELFQTLRNFSSRINSRRVKTAICSSMSLLSNLRSLKKASLKFSEKFSRNWFWFFFTFFL